MQAKQKPWIIDTTLRDGEQAPGVAFSTDEKMAIARALDDLGVQEIEAGTPALGKQEQEFLSHLNRSGLRCRISAWCRARFEDVHDALACGMQAIHISTPLAPQRHGAPQTQAERDTLIDLVKFTARCVPHVSVGVIDSTRTPWELVVRFADSAANAGAFRVRLADTVGSATPLSVSRIIKRCIQSLPGMQVEFHAHNDLGLATANAVTALESGADAVSATVNGIGERAGNAALEQICLWHHLSTPGSNLYTIESLNGLCKLVAHCAKRTIPGDQPVCGPRIFEHESGIHCRELIDNPLSYQLYEPQTVGRSDFKITAGKHSGSASLQYLLARAGNRISRKQAAQLLPAVRAAAVQNKGGLSQTQLIAIEKACHDGVMP